MDFIVSLVANRYVLGTAAVAIFAHPVIMKAAEILNSISATLANVPGVN